MSDQLEQLRQLAADFVEAGEEVLAAVNVNYGGKVNMDHTPTGLAALNEQEKAIGDALGEERKVFQAPVEFPIAKQMAMVLTGGRILVWSRGGFKGKPKAYLGEVSLGVVEKVEIDVGKMADRVAMRLASGWEVHFEANKTDGLAAFGQQVAALTADETWQGDQF